MKTFLLRAFSFFTLACFTTVLPAARAADTNPPPRLAIELRDGSRVVGTSVEDNLKFHSGSLGDLKLDVKGIRSVECVSTNSAKLITTNGDTLAVQFVDSELAVKTSFGKVKLPVDSIRKFTVSANGKSASHPLGLIALWSGEGDGIDAAGSNNAILTDITFGEGELGQAFLLNGVSSFAKIPASAALNVGEESGLTISAWIKPSTVREQRPIVEWNNGSGYGSHFWISTLHHGAGCLYANLLDTNGREHIIASGPGLIIANTFQYVAVTYDRTSGLGTLYLNGKVAVQNNMGIFTPQTTYDLYLGFRPAESDQAYFWTGGMDEVSLYNRVLSASEIQEVYEADNEN